WEPCHLHIFSRSESKINLKKSTMIELIHEIVTSAFIFIGACFMLISAVGILGIPDFYTRMSAITKAGTLGVVFIVLGIGLHFNEISVLVKTISIIFFILLTSAVAAHVISQAAVKSNIPFWKKTDLEDFKE